MSEAKVVFNFEGIDTMIQCTNEEKMKYICERYGTKLQKNINTLLFLYGGNQLRFESSFEQVANSLDKAKKEMKVLVYTKESDDLICPKCGEKIKIKREKLDELISSNNNIKDKIDGIVFDLDMIIKNATLMNTIKNQLKNINIVLNTINEDIKKNNKKITNLLNDNININSNLNNNNFKMNNINMMMNNNMMLTQNNMNMFNNNMNMTSNNNMNMFGNNHMNNMSNNIMQFNNNINNMNMMGNNNISNMNNNMMLNNNMNSFNRNMNNQNQPFPEQEESKNSIFITFTYPKRGQVYLDVDKNQTFTEVIKLLKNKYEWVNSIKNPKYSVNGRQILPGQFITPINKLGIEECTDISIAQS